MSRPLLLALLGASLAANAVMFLVAPRSSAALAAAPKNSGAGTLSSSAAAAPSSNRKTDNSSAATASAAPAATAATPRGLTWKEPRTDADFRQLVADLRAAGFPPRLIATVVRELYEKQADARSPQANAPFWQHRSATISKEMQEFRLQTSRALQEIVDAQIPRSQRLDPVARRRQYGNLSDAKIDAIDAIERDYREMQQENMLSQLRGGSGSIDDFASYQKQNNLLTGEKRADLSAILSAEELREYELHNSDAARDAARTASNLALTPAEFVALYEARKTFDASAPTLSGNITQEQWAARQAAQTAYYEQARAALPDDRFYSFLRNNDPTYRAIAQLGSQYPSVTPAGSYEAYKLQVELQGALTKLRGNSGLKPDEIIATYADINARLEKAVGIEAAAAFRKTNPGRMFNAPTIRMNPTATPRG